MKTQIRFAIINNNQLTQKIISYFTQFDFKLIEHKDGFIKLAHSSTLLDAWKSNPLKWGSEVSVSIFDSVVSADFYIDTDAQMNTKEEKAVWQTFIEDFQNYLTNGIAHYSKINSAITDNRKSRLGYLSWAVLGTLFGGLLSLFYSRLMGGNSTLGLFLIPVLASIFLAWKIRYTKTNKAL